jgi:hypothetical protein
MAYNNEYRRDYWSDDNDYEYNNGNYRKKTILEMNRMDKDFVELTRKNQQTGIVKHIGCFKSGSQGSYIRNAITGIRNYEHKVGSFDENLYFKVNIATGEYGKDPLVLFYDTPKEHETQFFTSLNPDIKMNWQEKYQSYIRV